MTRFNKEGVFAKKRGLFNSVESFYLFVEKFSHLSYVSAY